MAPPIKRKPLEWNVFTEDFSSRQIVIHNVFDHGGFYNDVKKFARKYKDDRVKFEEEVKRSLMYFYWSKCEWEIIMSSWPPNERFKNRKVDVFEQIVINWDKFIDYLWENKGSAK